MMGSVGNSFKAWQLYRVVVALVATALMMLCLASANAATATATPRVSFVVGATTTASAVTQPAIVTITKSANVPNTGSLAINYSSTVVGGCEGATSEGCFSIRTNTTPIVSVPLNFVTNRLTMLKNNRLVNFDEQITSISVSLFQETTQIGNTVNLSPGAAGVITFNMEDIDQLQTREYRIVYKLDLNAAPEDGTYTGTWPIILGTISLINP